MSIKRFGWWTTEVTDRSNQSWAETLSNLFHQHLAEELLELALS
jgi:hypothetical protein